MIWDTWCLRRAYYINYCSFSLSEWFTKYYQIGFTIPLQYQLNFNNLYILGCKFRIVVFLSYCNYIVLPVLYIESSSKYELRDSCPTHPFVHFFSDVVNSFTLCTHRYITLHLRIISRHATCKSTASNSFHAKYGQHRRNLCQSLSVRYNSFAFPHRRSHPSHHRVRRVQYW